ncbi:MAG: hypothetical protein DMF47_01670 [Verrucomicrobia bacterium]|nr:MAG: hypothetical protein DMF47_01670 [Verrucomicrobiota bacterium]
MKFRTDAAIFLGSARVPRVGDGVLATADLCSGRNHSDSLLQRDAATNTRAACATQSWAIGATIRLS